MLHVGDVLPLRRSLVLMHQAVCRCARLGQRCGLLRCFVGSQRKASCSLTKSWASLQALQDWAKTWTYSLLLEVNDIPQGVSFPLLSKNCPDLGFVPPRWTIGPSFLRLGDLVDKAIGVSLEEDNGHKAFFSQHKMITGTMMDTRVATKRVCFACARVDHEIRRFRDDTP